MQITVSRTGINNFHNAAPINLRVPENTVLENDGIEYYLISKRQAARIERHFCGITGCRCPAGGLVVQLDPDGNEWGIPSQYITMEA